VLCECDEIEPAGRPGLAWWILYMVCQQQQQLPAGFLEQMSDKPCDSSFFTPPLSLVDVSPFSLVDLT